MQNGLRTKQLLGVLALVLLSFFMIGLCTNTIVLPFVNLSGALHKEPTSSSEPLSSEEEGANAAAPLSFLEKVRYFEAENASKTLTREVFDFACAFVVAPVSEENLPETATVGEKTALVARMGFLVRENEDGTRTLMDETGNVIFSAIPEGFEFTGHWNENGEAVFSSAAGYVVYSPENRVFLETEYEPKLYAVTGVDLPVYYNRSDGEFALSYQNGAFGYVRREDSRVVYQYANRSQSYQFSEGYGALGAENEVIILKFEAEGLIVREFLSLGTLVQPEAAGVSALGYYRMDHGLMLVLRQTENGIERLILNLNSLSEGNQFFYLPRDFNLISYTDGVFLLEKDGRYGYLDYTGRWIVDPVYTEATPFSEGLAVVCSEDGKKGVIDRSGAFVIPPEFEEITFSGGVFTLCADNEWVVFHKVR